MGWMGAGLSTLTASCRRACSRAQRTTGTGVSSWQTTTSAQAMLSAKGAAISTVSWWLAPGATAIWFCPSASTKMSAVPVAARAVSTRPSIPMPASLRAARMRRPSVSAPTQPIILTSPPSRRAAMA